MLRSTLWSVLMFSILSVIGCTKPKPVQMAHDEIPEGPRATSLEEHRQQMAMTDFASVLNHCTFKTLENTSLQEPIDSFPMAWLASVKKSIGKDKVLTDSEAKALGVWYLPNDEDTNILRTLGSVKNYYRKTGHLPESGIDICYCMYTDEGIEHYLASSPDEQLTMAARGINLITGQFFKSFQATTWQPGELLVEVTADPEALAKATLQYPREADAMDKPYDEVWRVKMWGQTPNTVLWTTEAAYSADE